MITQKHLNDLSFQIIGAAIEVHKILGRGVLERVYRQCMKVELRLRNINFISEHKIPVIYKGTMMESDFRCDLLIENLIVIEFKAVSKMHPAFEAKLLNHMKLLKSPKGILINFNCYNIFKEGQKTFVNEFYKILPEE
ncbi:GxxExxY protein [Flavobacterium fryxellicola]|uniref:GxxExxY protein n=1 Tax=Flavobacterium fryxellicola TaxID=249352 RepID=A0A167U5C7_9FLAO|nr:GxxExxY protein [Flavobacterium fryxellicola]OAB25267.1 GxxExxY protein [Flavobacterium fryxellicola]SHN75512.1 GxxExxY protein [Flavobacterium fryxellicola]